MSIEYACESYKDVVEDIKPLLKEHWKELALYQDDIPLDPDYDHYAKGFEMGLFRCFTVRENGKLIGYAIFLVKQHPHYQHHRWAQMDILWVHPGWRNAKVGTGLMDVVERELTKDGPVVITLGVKTQHPELGWMLKARGYDNVELYMARRFS